MHLTNSLKINFHIVVDTLIVVSFEFFFKCKFSLVTTLLSKRENSIKNHNGITHTA